MKWLLAWFVVMVSITATCAQSAPNRPAADATYTLSGTVVNSATGEPVRRALVQIYLGSEQAVLTDGGGHFEFSGLPAGQTSVTVQKPGFFNEQQLDRGQIDPALAQVGPNVQPITLKLVPEGVITGRIESREGEALENLAVRLIRSHIINGRRQFDQVSGTNTDDDGMFRVGNLIPGVYYVVAGPSQETIFQGAPGSKGREMTFPEVFYPGVREFASAVPIQVAAGQQLQADISVTAEPVFKISGAVDTADNQGMNIEFLSSSGESLSVPTEYGPQGSFRAKIPAGSYVMKANVFGEGAPMSGTANLTVNSDLAGIRVSLAPVATVPVRVSFQKTRQRESKRDLVMRGVPATAITIHLRREGSAFVNRDEWLSVGGSSDAAANSIHDLAPGRYSLEIPSAGGQWYVRSAQCGGTDLLRDDLTVVGGARLPAIEIVMRDDGAQLSGTATLGGQPARATIIAIPDGAIRSSTMTVSDPNGRFNFQDLPPGDYSVIAVDRADGLEYSSVDALSPYVSGATRVSLVPNGQANVEVNVMEAGK